MKKVFILLGLSVSLIGGSLGASDYYWQYQRGHWGSAHPYFSDSTHVIEIYQPGAEHIQVHFARLDVETDYDYVELRDSYGRVVERYTGSYEPFWSEPVSGNTAYVVLLSDEAEEYFGFHIDQYRYYTGFHDPIPPLPPFPPFPPMPPYEPIPPVPPAPFPAVQISVSGYMNHGDYDSQISLRGDVLGGRATSGMVVVKAQGEPERILDVQLTGTSFATDVIALPYGVQATIEIIFQMSDGRRYMTSGTAMAGYPGYRGFMSTRHSIY